MTEGTSYALYQRLAGPRPWAAQPLLGPWTWTGMSFRSPEELARLWRGMGAGKRSDLLSGWKRPTRTARSVGAQPLGTVDGIQGLLVSFIAHPGEDVARVDAWGEHEEWPAREVAISTTQHHRAVRARGMGAWVDAVERRVPPPGVQLRAAVVDDRAVSTLVHVIALREDGLSVHCPVWTPTDAGELGGAEAMDEAVSRLVTRSALAPGELP